MLEKYLAQYEKYYNKYLEAEEGIHQHPDMDKTDLDKDERDITRVFFETKVGIKGLRREFDKPQPAVQTSGGNQTATGGQGPVSKAKIHHSKPGTLQEETDLKDWIRWLPTWNNYVVVTELANQPREIQVGTFWECCSPGFLNTIQSSLGIKLDTARPLNEIHKIIEDHLRSLRDQNIDMKTLLEARKDRGQDYTSFCNEIKDKALFADTVNVNEDRLLIAVLVKGLDDTEDIQKLLESKPKTFEEARITLLKFECARNSARAIQNKKEGDIMAAGTKKSEYQRTKYSTDDPNPDAHQDQEDDKIPRCYVCTRKHKPPYCVWCEACQRHHPRPYCRRKR